MIEKYWQYAFSAGMASKNKLQIDYDSVEYEVISNISFEDIMNMNNEIISIWIECDLELNLEIIIIDKRCFSLSTTRLKHLFEEGNISLLSGKTSPKCKVKNGDIILIDRKSLIDIWG